MAALRESIRRRRFADYGKRGYLAPDRALDKQYRASETESIPAMDALIEWLRSRSAGEETSIVHGDYRLDNVIFTPRAAHFGGARLGTLTVEHRATRVSLHDVVLARAGVGSVEGSAGTGIPSVDHITVLRTHRASAVSNISISIWPSTCFAWRAFCRAFVSVWLTVPRQAHKLSLWARQHGQSPSKHGQWRSVLSSIFVITVRGELVEP